MTILAVNALECHIHPFMAGPDGATDNHDDEDAEIGVDEDEGIPLQSCISSSQNTRICSKRKATSGRKTSKRKKGKASSPSAAQSKREVAAQGSSRRKRTKV